MSLVDKEQVLEALKQEEPFIWSFSSSDQELAAKYQHERDVEAVQLVLPREAMWKMVPHKMMGSSPCCSLCQKFAPLETKYCPNCGARMKNWVNVEQFWKRDGMIADYK